MNTGLPTDLSPAARAYLDAFPAGDVVAFPIGGLDRVGLPVWVVALFPDTPDLAGIMPYGVGYGATDEAAVLGGLGEIAEMVFPTLTLSARPRTSGSHAGLVAALGERAVADPLTLCLPAGSPVGRDTVLDWVEARRWADGSSVLVPIDLAAYSAKELAPGYRPFTTIISNGMGAGPDLDWAVGHGLCEILQRDGNGLLFRALDRGVTLALPGDLPAGTHAILDRFAAAGVDLLPKFATDQFGLPNLYCVGTDRIEPAAPIMATACGEACHPDVTAALEKCVTEFAASRARKAFAHGPAALVRQVAPEGYVERFMAQAGRAAKSSDDRAFRAMGDWTRRDAATLRGWLAETMLSRHTTRDFSTLPSTPAPSGHDRSRVTRAAVAAAGFDILYVDMTPPGCPVTTVKVIVPGMEVETMSYYRIGERNTRKLIDMGSPLIRFTGESETVRPVRLTPEALDGFGRQPLFDTAVADAIVGPLYPLYREPEAHHVAWAERRA
ncbi:YcaO-like family protein [Sphingomonas bacterium]|uniref:YcaO-like family protein n=1 Tax=Sphingomonas bacterium TaxID=1895847 RepID=UPI0015757169|nr:YcaO-like family protein [Sphingomonas bacterium]